MTTDLLIMRALASVLDDLERTRIQTSNRIGAMERELGEALPHLYYLAEPISEAEHRAELELKRAWRKHPLAPWAATVPGCGEKLIARLIAITGDPAERANCGKFLAYCGHGDPARSEIPRNATQVELFKRGSPHAKKAAWKLGFQFMRTPGSPYRAVYDEWRDRYADKTHERPCKRCGPSGHPAQPGSAWSLGHQHAAAIRNTVKAFLKDLYGEAERLRSGVPV